MPNPPQGLSALSYVGSILLFAGIILALAAYGYITVDKPIKIKRDRKLGYVGFIMIVLGLGFLIGDYFRQALPASVEKSTSTVVPTAIPFDVQIVDPLQLQPFNLNASHQLVFTVGQSIAATFRMRNVGNTTAHFEAFGVAIRGPNICPLNNQWEGGVYDFDSIMNFTLHPGDEYAYQQSKRLYAAGVYFAEPIAKVPGRGSWGDIPPNQRIYFVVQESNTTAVIVDYSCVTPFP